MFYDVPSGWLAPHSLQNFATIGMTELQFLQTFVSTPAGGVLPHFEHTLAV